MVYASNFDSRKAIEYYSLSLEKSKNPAPYINRANLLSKRMREFEALQDLLEAKKLDEAQGNEFRVVIGREIAQSRAISSMYFNGMREKLLNDFKGGDRGEIAEKILCNCFGINYQIWQYGIIKRDTGVPFF